MARYREYSYEQSLMLPIRLSLQVQPGTFEYTINYLVDNEIDLTVFESRYHNDETGAPAYDPAVLLKIILFAYSRGITSSRRISQACEENVVFMALSADTRPHFTTIAEFITQMNEQIPTVFSDVLSVCYTEGMIGKQMFAIDGCKISSNCSKGTTKEGGEVRRVGSAASEQAPGGRPVGVRTRSTGKRTECDREPESESEEGARVSRQQ